MGIGDRIKQRLRALGQDTRWLIDTTRIPQSTVYEIINGRMHRTTRLPTLAAALGVRALWLERGVGPMLEDAAEGLPAIAQIEGLTAIYVPEDVAYVAQQFDKLREPVRSQIRQLIDTLVVSQRPRLPPKTRK